MIKDKINKINNNDNKNNNNINNKNNIIITKATINDINELCNLLNDLFSIEKDFTPNYEKQKKGLLEIINSNNSIIFVAKKNFDNKNNNNNNKIIGMVSLQILISTAEGGKVGLLEDLIINKNCRNKGIGTKLIKTVEEYCIKNNLLRLSLLSDKNNKNALLFYKSKNYNTTNLICLRKKFGE